MIFQVTGLPRSGTAFVASVLNLHPKCLCHHDLAAERDDWKEYSEYLEKRFAFVGESSTYGWLPRAHRLNGPKVVLLRDPQEIQKSVQKIMGANSGSLDLYIKAAEDLKDWSKRVHALEIHHEQLFTVDGLSLLWEHVFGSGEPFPIEKILFLTTMNVQRQNPKAAFGDARHVRQRLLTPCTVSKPL